MPYLGPIHQTRINLMPGLPLCVYAVRGPWGTALIDTGIAAMKDQILALGRELGGVRYALITHAHVDHIGCNQAVQQAFQPLFMAGGALPWIEDMEAHYNAFCLPEELPDSPEQRAEIMGLVDGAVSVNLVIGEGTQIRLGDGIELQTLALPGHKLEEIGFLETSTQTLIVGDVLLALVAPFFHGFQTARGFHASLNRLQSLLETGRARRILAAHHLPLTPEEALPVIAQTRQFLLDLEEATLEAAQALPFRELWQAVCKRMDKQLEFRGYAMLRDLVTELLQDGRLAVVDGRIVRR